MQGLSREAIVEYESSTLDHVSHFDLVRMIYHLEDFIPPEQQSPPEQQPPPKDRRGTPVHEVKQWVYYKLDAVFVAAHGGKAPTRGWPEFRDKCLGPLCFPFPTTKRGRETVLHEARKKFGQKS
jgi:hypothetical protein